MASSFHLLPLLLCCSSLLLQRTSAAAPSLLLQLRDESHPLLRRPRTKIFHPSTGLCVTRRTMADPLKLGPCSASDSWRYTPQEFLMVTGTYFCLRAVGLGAPVRLGIICDPSDSRWQLVSGSEKTHLATNLTDGTEVWCAWTSTLTAASSPIPATGSMAEMTSTCKWIASGLSWSLRASRSRVDSQ
ncbi:hypothetical protein C4D60_Mb06t07770 [Musa balbisiana]|uniref:Uncharacterized protein n=1 Tax=Musa balbisiana TaxID=52838 RepID=A0A4S8IM43_MUSBA|nr:hypothetical protein C4D60_Mb06t07770 [Musa balbisiana]